MIKAVIIVGLALLCSSCGLTPAQMENFNAMAREFNRGSQETLRSVSANSTDYYPPVEVYQPARRTNRTTYYRGVDTGPVICIESLSGVVNCY